MGRKRKLETNVKLVKCRKSSDIFSLTTSERSQCDAVDETPIPVTSEEVPAHTHQLEEWTTGRSWLVYDVKTNSFTTGCTIMKSENVSKHLTGKGDNSHIAAEKIISCGNNFAAAQQQHIKKSTESVTSALRNIYFMAQNSLPNSIFGDLNVLCIEQGCQTLQNMKVDKHTTYEHSESIAQFQDAICAVIHDDMIASIGYIRNCISMMVFS